MSVLWIARLTCLCGTVFCAAFLIQSCGSRDPLPSDDPQSLVAFSLRNAERILRSGHSGDARLARVGGIHRLLAVVYDPAHEDIILVGRGGKIGSGMKLDDLVVAMRAVLVSKQWPLVSTDPTTDTETTG